MRKVVDFQHYNDASDAADATEGDNARGSSPVAASGMPGQQQMVAQQDNFSSPERLEDERRLASNTPGIITGDEDNQCHHHHSRNHRNQSHHSDTLATWERGANKNQRMTTGVEEEEESDSASQVCRNRCPHHPRERLVRFDPSGQAWCDRLDCWDCYRLMKIAETLGYSRLIDRGGQPLIHDGMEAWTAFVLSQRPFIIVVAIEAAIAQCKARGVDVPDLSGEAKKLVKLPPLGP